MSSSTAQRIFALLPALCVAVAACTGGGPDGSESQTQTPAPGETAFCDLSAPCQQIAAACMPKDEGTGDVHACHVTAMSYGIEADCAKSLPSCLATCEAAPALTDGPPDDLFAACRDSGVETKDAGNTGLSFPTEPLLTFTTDSKDLTIELRTAPEQPIHVGRDGEGQLLITDASTGAVVDGLDIGVTTFMPVMGHSCSPIPVKIEAQGQGVYAMKPFLASMKGKCEIKLAISGARSAHAVSPTFDVTQ